MAGNAIVTVGDSSSHGGTVISGSSLATCNGAQIARVGDLHSCPKHGITAIVSSPAAATIEAGGALIAVTGAVAACGAVITGSNTGFTA